MVKGVLLACVLMLLAAAPARADSLLVTTTADHADGACNDDCSLRDAVAAASPGDTIVMPAGDYALTLGTLKLSRPVTITGPGQSQPTDQPTATLTGSDRLFDVTTGGSVTIAHLVLAHAFVASDVTGGAALVQRNGTVTLDHDVLDGDSDNLSGGALTLTGGVLNIADSEIRGSHAFAGGGLYIASGTANVTRTLWLSNDGSTGGGGAIYNAGGFLTVSDSTFAGNTASAAVGGAIYATASTALRNVTFEDNIASGHYQSDPTSGGSALYALGTSVSVANVLFGDSGYGDNCEGTLPSDAGGNLDTGDSCGLETGERTVRLGPLALNGGATRSLLPWADSPAVDGGDNASCVGPDQRGAARAHSAADPCDVGALEGAAGAAAPAPSIGGGATDGTGSVAAALGATIGGQGLPTTYRVEYGLTATYDGDSDVIPLRFSADPVQHVDVVIPGLQPSTTYHYRFVAESSAGTTDGADHTFTTTPTPAATTGGASEVGSGTATLAATIDGHGGETQYRFDYGPTATYGGQTDSASLDTGSGPVSVSLPATGLAAGTTYHYRVVAVDAVSGADVATGADATFTTRAVGVPVILTPSEASTAASAAVRVTGTADPGATVQVYEGDETLASADVAGDGTWSAVTSALADGTHRIYAQATDSSFNTSAASGVRTFAVDTSAPPPVVTPTPTPTPVATPAATATPSPAPVPVPTPTPVPGKTVVVAKVSGTVLVKQPGAKGFVAVDAAAGIPLGSIVDTRHGVVRLTARTGQTAIFYDGLFKVTQTAATTDLTLTEPLAPCRKGAHAAASKPKTRKLWGNGTGSFRTRGQYSAATVRGTNWLVQDSCAGTLTRVKTGVVSVRDQVRNRTILLKAGKSYLAKPKR